MTQSEKFWDKKAQSYANSAIGDEASYQRKLLETQQYFTPDMRILEIGCGTGSTAIAHAPFVAHIDAIDISDNMLEIARARAADANVENIQFTHATLDEFNADTASMDAVLALNVIHLLPNRQQVLAEVARVLKPGGVFVSSTACLGSSVFRFICLITPLAKRFGLMPDLLIIKESELAQELIDAGFSSETQWHHGSKDTAVFIIASKL